MVGEKVCYIRAGAKYATEYAVRWVSTLVLVPNATGYPRDPQHWAAGSGPRVQGL